MANVNDVPSGVPTISGTATEDQTLTADASGITDDDGLGAFNCQWLRDGVAISGANASTYTLGNVDVGAQITVQVSYTDGNGTAEGPLTSALTSAVANVNDAPSGIPTITGTATEDQTLTADASGISDDDGLGTFSYQWLRDGTAITGATATTYTLGDADVGSQISVRVSYTDGNGTAESVTSAATSAVTNINDAPSGAPSITGTPAEDQTLTADTSGISDDDGIGPFIYQWQRDGVNILGATSSTYTLGDDDVGAIMQVTVGYTDANGTAEAIASAATSAVTNVNDAPTGVPTIVGSAQEDATLTVDTTSINDGDGVGAFSFQWLRDGSPISGANASSYSPGDDDVGSQISVHVSYTDGHGTWEGALFSSATPVVSNVNDTPQGTIRITTAPWNSDLVIVDTSEFSDADGLGTLSYQWTIDGTPMLGANDSTLSFVGIPGGSEVGLLVSYTDGQGTLEGPISSTTIVRPLVGRVSGLSEVQLSPELAEDYELAEDTVDMPMMEIEGLPETSTLAFQQAPFANFESYRIQAAQAREIGIQANPPANDALLASTETESPFRIARRFGLPASRPVRPNFSDMPTVDLTLSPVAYISLATALDEFQTSVEAEEQHLNLVAGVASGVFLVATAATALWMLSATSFVSMLSTSLPAWANFDPIFILRGHAAGTLENDASIADLIAEGSAVAQGERA